VIFHAAVLAGADGQQRQAAAAAGDGARGVSCDLDHGRRLDRGRRRDLRGSCNATRQAGLLAPPAKVNTATDAPLPRVNQARNSAADRTEFFTLPAAQDRTAGLPLTQGVGGLPT
jgi:hypothetical protein